MVTAARLQWAIGQLRNGMQARLRINSHDDKVIVHLCFLTHASGLMSNEFLINTLEGLARSLPTFVVTDHGHARSDGCSQMSFLCVPIRARYSAVFEQRLDEIRPVIDERDVHSSDTSASVDTHVKEEPWHAAGGIEP